MGSVHYVDPHPWADPGEWYCYAPDCRGVGSHGPNEANTRVIEIGENYYCEPCLMTAAINGEVMVSVGGVETCTNCGEGPASICHGCYDQNYELGREYESENEEPTTCSAYRCYNNAEYCSDCAAEQVDAKCGYCGDADALCYDHARSEWDLTDSSDPDVECEYCHDPAYDKVCRSHWRQVRCPECSEQVSCVNRDCKYTGIALAIEAVERAQAAQPANTTTDDGKTVTVDGVTIRFHIEED